MAVIVQLWKYRRDAFAARIDEFCKMLFEAADAGAEYWMTKKASKLDKNASTEARTKIVLLETKLDGYQQKINLFSLLVAAQIKAPNKDKMFNLMASFFDALTGGNFGADAKPVDATRSRLVYASGADLVAHLRATSPQPTWLSFVLLLVAFAAIGYFVFKLVVTHKTAVTGLPVLSHILNSYPT